MYYPLSPPEPPAPPAPPAPPTPENTPWAIAVNNAVAQGALTPQNVTNAGNADNTPVAPLSSGYTSYTPQQIKDYFASNPTANVALAEQQFNADPAVVEQALGAVPSMSAVLSQNAPSAPQAPAPYSSPLAPATANDTNQAFNQTYNALQYGNTTVKPVDVVDQETGSTSQKLTLVDSKGNPLPPDNVVSLGNGVYDLQMGSAGGTIHTYVKVDPTTGNVKPIENYNQQVNYTGGQKGGFVNETASALSQIPLLNQAVAIVAPEAYPYLQGLNAINAVNNKNYAGAALSALSGASTLPAGTLPFDPSTLKDATNVASAVNAIATKNPLALANAVMQATDTTLPSEVGAGAKLVSAIISANKNDMAGFMNSMMGFAKSQDPKISSTAKQVISEVNNGTDPKVALNDFADSVGISPDVIKTMSSIDPSVLSQAINTNQPINLTSTGTSDSPAGTIFTQADGTKDIVLAGGQTVKLSDYQDAINSGGKFSIDGNLQSSLSPTDLQAKIDSKDPNVKYLGKNEDGEDEYTYDDPVTKLRSSYVNGEYVGSIKLGDTGEVPITGGTPAVPLQPTGKTTEPQTTTDPKTGISTTVEDIDGSTVTSVIDPNTGINQQTTVNPDGTKQVTTVDNKNGTKVISTYDSNGKLTGETEEPLDSTGDNTIPSITIIDKKIPISPDFVNPSTTPETTPPVIPPVAPVTPPVTPPVEPPVTPPVEPPVEPPVVTTPVTSPVSTPVSTPVNTPVSVPSTPKTPTTTTSGGGLPSNMPTNFGGHTPNPIVESLLKTYMTQQAFKDPLANLEKLVKEEQQSEKPMIDPRLAQILQERSAPKQSSYYNYGQEPQSVEDVLALRDSAGQTYKTGGHVQPLAHASGGALPVVNNRHDFRHGAHVAGEGDGTSDDIPAMLADGEFVFPADVVSALGNGSTKAGTDKLYEMMHSIRARARKAHPSDLPPDALKSPLDYLKGRKK